MKDICATCFWPLICYSEVERTLISRESVSSRAKSQQVIILIFSSFFFKMWKLVVFNDENTASIVSSDWEKDGQSFWPDYRTQILINSATEARETPKPSWRKYYVRVIGIFGKYQKLFNYFLFFYLLIFIIINFYRSLSSCHGGLTELGDWRGSP